MQREMLVAAEEFRVAIYGGRGDEWVEALPEAPLTKVERPAWRPCLGEDTRTRPDG